MLYTKSQIIEKTNSANYVEIYTKKNAQGEIHTDNLDSSVELDTIDNLPYNVKGEVDVDIEIMDKEDYSHSVLANSSASWEDFGWEDDEKVAVIILNEQPETQEQLTKAKYYSVHESGSNDDVDYYIGWDGEKTMDEVNYSKAEAEELVETLTRRVLDGKYGEEAKQSFLAGEWGYYLQENDFDDTREFIEDDKDEPMSIGEQIATLRSIYGWTQKQLADKSGLDRTYISRVEGGAISVGMEVLNKIADALGCEVRLVEK